MRQLINVNIDAVDSLVSPERLYERIPVTEKAQATVRQARTDIQNMINGTDNRCLLVVGPCSIHDTKAAMDYARRLSDIQQKVSAKLMIVMRVYFEKPRTTIGWKGLINDPDMDGSCRVSKGLEIARELLRDINELGLPVGTEMLDPISPQYTSDLVSWASIGARTTESQTHREMASGLSMPVGFKNSTDGSLDVAVAAMQASKNPHTFIGLNHKGNVGVFRTKGNPYGHVILRGGKKSSNYHPENIKQAVDDLTNNNLFDRVMVDCSHANSGKKHEKQGEVLKNVIHQITKGNRHILGLMLESNLNEGSQKITDNMADLAYGVSVTDECIGWDRTVELIDYAYNAL